MTHIGFTGTRRGMTTQQRAALYDLLEEDYPSYSNANYLHHGSCRGADAEANSIARTCGYHTIAHPSMIAGWRAYVTVDLCYGPKPALDRNRDIVNSSALLIATPGEPEEQLRSGTWATVRYARKIGKPVLLVLPDGTVRRDG